MEVNNNRKSGYVAIIGRPNVGKSTLMNCMIGQKIAISSSKPQTTRNRIRTVYTDERGQMIFLDTPGINKAKNKLGDYMLTAALGSIRDADVVLWLVEPTDKIGKGEQYIMEELRKVKAPVILCMNKIDSVSKEELIGFVDHYSKAFDFAEIVPVSAKNNENIDTLAEQLFKYLPYGPLFYDEDELTDQPMKQIVAEIIREKALHCLDDEVPHGIAVVVEKYKERTKTVYSNSNSDRKNYLPQKLNDHEKKEGISDKNSNRRIKEHLTDIEATIICERESHKGIIIGRGGEMLKKIGSTARYEIEQLTGTKVGLKLWVKVNKEWRNSDSALKNYGYDPKMIQ